MPKKTARVMLQPEVAIDRYTEEVINKLFDYGTTSSFTDGIEIIVINKQVLRKLIKLSAMQGLKYATKYIAG